MTSSNIYQTKMRTDLGQWLYQSSFCLWARRGAAGAAFGRVWDPPLQKTKPFRVCRRGRILAGPSGNGRRLGRAARCAAPTAIQHRCRWFGKPRRRHGTAPAAIFANSGPSGPGEHADRHSDFARRKRRTDCQEGVPRNGGPGGGRIWARSAHLSPPPGASLASFWASRKKLAAGAAKRPFDIAFRFIRRQHKKPPAFPKEVSIL